MIPPKMPDDMSMDMPDPLVPVEGEADAPDLEAPGRERRAAVASEALSGGDPATLPSEVQDALMDVATQLATKTHMEHGLQGEIGDAVALIAAAHAFLTAQGSEMAAAIAPAMLNDPNKAMMLVDGMTAILNDPETMELFMSGGASPEAAEMEPEPEPQGPREPEPMSME